MPRGRLSAELSAAFSWPALFVKSLIYARSSQGASILVTSERWAADGRRPLRRIDTRLPGALETPAGAGTGMGGHMPVDQASATALSFHEAA